MGANYTTLSVLIPRALIVCLLIGVCVAAVIMLGLDVLAQDPEPPEPPVEDGDGPCSNPGFTLIQPDGRMVRVDTVVYTPDARLFVAAGRDCVFRNGFE